MTTLLLDPIANHLVAELLEYGVDVINTGGGCEALCTRDPHAEDGWSPILITDGEHGVRFEATGHILIALTDPDDVDQWWEYAATALTVRALARVLREAITDPIATPFLLAGLGRRPSATHTKSPASA